MKTCPYQYSTSLRKELQISKQFVGCGNIVQCYGDMLSIDPGQGMLVYNLFLEYAYGCSLLDLMIKKYGGMIPKGDAKCYARMLLEGIWDIHRRDFVQKPENIIVFPSYQNGSISRLKIADFGLVRRPSERYHMPDPWMPTFLGTTVYMSPESFIYGHISTALDILSIGCIVLEMITGKVPWEYQGLMDLGNKIGFSIYSPKIPETMSSTGKDFLMKCFQWDHGKRWTANMLLSHPFLLPDPSPIKSLHHDEVYSCLSSME